MEGKANFKANLKGAMTTPEGKDEMINKEFYGDGMLVIAFNDTEDGKTESSCACVGKWSDERYANVLRALHRAWGGKHFKLASMLHEMMEACSDDAEDADDEAFSDEKIAELVESEIEKALSELKPEEELGEE